MKGLLVPAVIAALAAQAAPRGESFEVAVISASTASPTRGTRGGAPRSGRYELRNATLLDLIRTAYAVDPDRVVGGPHWLELDRFDVAAKVPDTATRESVRPMLQTLLADRFKLAIRLDTQITPVYALTAGSDMHKLRASTSAPAICQPQAKPGVLTLTALCRGVTMAAFADVLPQLGRGYFPGRVVDATQLTGAWDFELTWTPLQSLAQAGADGVTMVNAVESQLGLRLEQRSVPLPALLIDSVNRTPTPNAPDAAARIPLMPELQFDTAEIKPGRASDAPSTRVVPPGEIRATATPLKTLIAFAWDWPVDMVVGPKWMDETRFDLTARTSVRIVDAQQQVDNVAVQQMVKKLLTARFGITSHVEPRPIPAWALVSTGAPRLAKADPQMRTTCFDGPAPGTQDPRTENPVLARVTTCQNITMGEFTERLEAVGAGYVQTPVADATGLEGRWTFTVAFSPPAAAPGSPAAAPLGALTLQQALERQLGLKLEARDRPIPVLVIDKIDSEPRAN